MPQIMNSVMPHRSSASVSGSVLSRRMMAISFLVSLLVPPFLLYAAWRTQSFRQRHWLLTLFVTYYGITLPIAYDPTGVGADGVRHLLTVYTYYLNLSFGVFLSDLGDILLLQGAPGSNDPYKHVLSYFVGGVLGMPGLFFPIVAFVYGYFFTGSMLLVFRKFKLGKLPWIVIFLALAFFLTRNIEALQAVRHPTAIWVLIYGILRYQETKQHRYLILMASTPLIHFGFLLIAIPAFLVILLGNKPVLYAALFVFSSTTNLLEPTAVTGIISGVELGEQKLRGYYIEEQIELQERGFRFGEDTAGGTRFWRAYMQAGYHKIAFNVLVYSLIFSGAYIFAMNRFHASIFATGLLTLTAANSFWFLGGAAGRMWEVGFLLAMAGFLLWRTSPQFMYRELRIPMVYKIGLYVSAAGLIPFFLFHLSDIFERMNTFLFGFPVLAAIMPEADLTIKEALRFILPI